MKSYSESWQRYRQILRTNFGIEIDRTPEEVRRNLGGHDLHLDVWEPDQPSKGTVILVHGAGGNGRVLAPYAGFATGIGWRVVAPDLPGYGLTRPRPGYKGDYAEWIALIAHLADETEGRVVLMGMSAGGMTALLAAEASSNVAGVIATTLLDLSDPKLLVRAARGRLMGYLSVLGFRLMPWLVDQLSVPVGMIAPMGAMSRDTDIQRYFSQDPLLGKLWVGLRLFRTMHSRRSSSFRPGCPLLLVHPGADDWTSIDMSQSAFDRVEAPKEFLVLTNGSHLPLEQPAFAELREAVRGFLTDISLSQKGA